MKRITFAAILLAVLLTLNFAPNLLSAQEPCQVILGTDDATGDKKIITICTDDLGGESTPSPTEPGTPTGTPTPITLPTIVPPPAGSRPGLWFSVAEAKSLPTSDPAWTALLSAAEASAGTPDLSNQDSDVNAKVLADALAWARTDDPKYREEVASAIRSIVQNQSESGGRTLALSRELAAYIAAADLVDLRNFDPALHNAFKQRLLELRSKQMSDGRNLVQTHEQRPNNWGTMACTSRAAIDVYIQDGADLQRTAIVFHGYVGNRSAYSGFKYGDLSWQADPANPVGINPVGATKSGQDISGLLPEEMRRAGGFKWPPGVTGYAWGGLSGATGCAEVLYRAGFPAYEWEDRALCRASDRLHQIGWQATGDDAGTVAVLNLRCGQSHPVNGTTPGKQMGWQQWTHSRAVAAQDVIVLSDTERIATGDSLVELQDEIDYVLDLEPEWIVAGEPYTTTLDGDVVFAQKMELE